MDLASQLKPISNWRGVGTVWTTEEITKVVGLFNDGHSMGKIAQQVQRSRGSIAGKLDRARKAGLLKPAAEKPNRNIFKSHKNLRENIVAKHQEKLLYVRQPEVIKKKDRIRLRLIESDTEVTFAELEAIHCKWPFGDPKQSDFRFCGCRRLVDKPYCEAHTLSAARTYK